jgi:hypothetical protein
MLVCSLRFLHDAQSEEYGPYFLATSVGNVTQGYCMDENESPRIVHMFEELGGLTLVV